MGKLSNILRWTVFAAGLTVNVWALWVMASEIGKDLVRFWQLPNFSTTSFFEWCKSMLFGAWLPKEAMYIHLYKKLVFAACNGLFLAVLLHFYTKGNRFLAIGVALIVILNLLLIFSPAVGNLH